MALTLTKELLTNEPQDLAKKLVKESRGDNGTTIKTQLRKFYNDFLVLQTKSSKIKTDDEFRTQILPLIFFSKAKLAYSYGKENIRMKEFVEGIMDKIDHIENAKDFENFLYFYQALIGYVTYELKIKKESSQTNMQNNYQGGGKKWKLPKNYS